MDPNAHPPAEEDKETVTDPFLQFIHSLDDDTLRAWIREQSRMMTAESGTDEETEEESEEDDETNEEEDDGAYEGEDLETDEKTDGSFSYFLIETRLIGRMAGSDGPAECCICRQEVALGEIVTELECGHWFDTVCILTWLNESGNCPLCRGGCWGGSGVEGVGVVFRLIVLDSQRV